MGTSVVSPTVSTYFFGNDGDGRIEKIIIQRFCFLSEKAVESVDGRQESKGLSVEFMD